MISPSFLKDFVSKDPEPSYVENVQFFFLEKGVAFNDFVDLPLPYILGMVWVSNVVSKKQEKDMKKSGKKGF